MTVCLLLGSPSPTEVSALTRIEYCKTSSYTNKTSGTTDPRQYSGEWSENSHFCQKCPSLRPKNGTSNGQIKILRPFYSSNIPQIWPLQHLFHGFITFGCNLGHISIFLLYIEMHVTSFDFGHFLLLWSYSTRPIEYNDSFNIFSLKQKLQQAMNSRSNFCLLANGKK